MSVRIFKSKKWRNTYVHEQTHSNLFFGFMTFGYKIIPSQKFGHFSVHKIVHFDIMFIYLFCFNFYFPSHYG